MKLKEIKERLSEKKNKDQFIGVRITVEVKNAIDAIAKETGTKPATVVREILEQSLNGSKNKKSY